MICEKGFEREKKKRKKERAFSILQRAIHQEIWKDFVETKSLSHVWKLLGPIAFNL